MMVYLPKAQGDSTNSRGRSMLPLRIYRCIGRHTGDSFGQQTPEFHRTTLNSPGHRGTGIDSTRLQHSYPIRGALNFAAAMDAFQAVSGYVSKMVSTGDGATASNAAKMKILLLDNDTVSRKAMYSCLWLTLGPGLRCIIGNNPIRSPKPPSLSDRSLGQPQQREDAPPPMPLFCSSLSR